jgi:hypothetical protein
MFSSAMKARWLVVLAVFSLATACADGANDEGSSEELEIVGTYLDQFDGEHEITMTTWTMSGVGVFHIDDFDNEAEYLVAENDADNDYSPGLWSRMDWTFDGEDLYFCQFAYDAPTKEDAQAADGADREDLEMGCADFGWSQLIAE